MIASITEVSASVVTSPMGLCSATSRSKRRMILPERVLGTSLTTKIVRGLASAPMLVYSSGPPSSDVPAHGGSTKQILKQRFEL